MLIGLKSLYTPTEGKEKYASSLKSQFATSIKALICQECDSARCILISSLSWVVEQWEYEGTQVLSSLSLESLAGISRASFFSSREVYPL